MNRLLLLTPIAPLLAEYDAQGVLALRYWRQGDHPPASTRDEPARGDAIGRQISRELREYFRGERREFTLPLRLEGTDFQRAVWAALRRIPFGETRSYGELARMLDRPGAARAVGQANACNPVPIVVPCHRVLAAGGGIGGYLGAGSAGSGVELKRWLLRHEGAGSASRAAEG